MGDVDQAQIHHLARMPPWATFLATLFGQQAGVLFQGESMYALLVGANLASRLTVTLGPLLTILAMTVGLMVCLLSSVGTVFAVKVHSRQEYAQRVLQGSAFVLAFLKLTSNTLIAILMSTVINLMIGNPGSEALSTQLVNVLIFGFVLSSAAITLAWLGDIFKEDWMVDMVLKNLGATPRPAKVR